MEQFLSDFFSKQHTPKSSAQAIQAELEKTTQTLHELERKHISSLPSLQDVAPHTKLLCEKIRSKSRSLENRRALKAPISNFFNRIKYHPFILVLFLLTIPKGMQLLHSYIQINNLSNIILYSPIALVASLFLWRTMRSWKNRKLDLIGQYEDLNPMYLKKYDSTSKHPYQFSAEWEERNFFSAYILAKQPNLKLNSIFFEIRQKGEFRGVVYQDFHNSRFFHVDSNSEDNFKIKVPKSTLQFFKQCLIRMEQFEEFQKQYPPLKEKIHKLTLIKSIILEEELIFEVLCGVNNFIKMGSSANRGMLLLGPPGTGKSYLSKVISEVYDIAFYSYTISSLKAEHIGKSGQNVLDLWQKARQNQPAIIFIDECDSIFSKRGGSNTDTFSDDIVNAFLPEWDGIDNNQSILVIGATNRPNSLDTAILSRFTYRITIPLPNSIARFKILEQETINRDIKILNPDITRIGEATIGMSGRDIVNFVQILLHKTDANNSIEVDNLIKLIRENNKSNQLTNINESATWNKLILPTETKQNLLGLAKLIDNYERLTEKFGETNIPRGVLLYGPPGTGKTQIARTLANESKVNFLARAGADIRGQWVGHSANNVKQLFDEAREKSPCIIFIDEIDSLASRDESSSTIDKETLGEFLSQMDGFSSSSDKIIVIAATNIKDSIDSALLSRFSRQIEIPLPSINEREKLYFTFLSDLGPFFEKNLNLSGVCSNIAHKTEGYSGRKIAQDIKNLTNEIQLEYINTDQDPILTQTEIEAALIP